MKRRNKIKKRASGFTLIEVILVLVVVVIISGISIPYFAGTYRGLKLKSASRTINRMARYTRSMAIMREEMHTVAINHETMEVFMGAAPKKAVDESDGEIDQDVLQRLGYTDNDGEKPSKTAGIDKEIHRYLPDGLTIKDFNKNWRDEDDEYPNFYLIRFFHNGQCDFFTLELEDNRGMSIRMENDPISGKITFEFTQ